MDNVLNQTLVGDKDQDYTQDTFRFTREGNVPDSSQQNSLIADDHMDVVSDDTSHEIADFCRRPYRIGSFEWLSGGNPGTPYFEVWAAEELRKTTIFSKLQGFLAFSATFCFRVVVNSQPTQVGGLIMSFYPGQKREVGKGMSDTYCYETQLLLPRYSGMPSSIINLGSTSEAELKIAYKGETPVMLVQDGEAGIFRINMLSPLLGGTNSEKVGVSVYMWLEDLKTYSTTPYAPAAKLQGTTETEAQSVAKAKPGGIISKGLDMVGNVATAASNVPGVSDYAMPVSWIAKGAAGVARWFGFSKPADTRPSKAMTLNPFKDFAHGAGVIANQTKLTVNDNQEVEVRPLGPTQEDEMSISFLMRRPTYLTQFSWASSAGDNSLLATFPVDPAEYMITGAVKGASLYAHTTVSYLANMFDFWRGNLLFTFTVFGSKFHSGRLRFIYVPGGQSLENAVAQLQYTYSHIVDIRDSNTITIKIPYMAVVPFRRIGEENGVLYVIVENPLIYHPSTTSSINIMCMVAGEDFAFAGPRLFPYAAPATGYTLTKPAATLQGFSIAPANDTPHAVDITNKESKDHSIMALKHTIGDPIISLRTLAKRMTENSRFAGNLETNTCLLIQANSLAHTTDYSSIPPTDYLDWITALFKFRTGGMRFALFGNLPEYMHYKFAPPPANFGNFGKGFVSGGSLNGDIVDYSSYLKASNYVTVPYTNKISGALQIEVPYYHNTPVIENGRNAQLTPENTTISTLTDHNVPLYIITSPLPSAPYELQLYRSGADDFNCGYFTGPPITIVPD